MNRTEVGATETRRADDDDDDDGGGGDDGDDDDDDDDDDGGGGIAVGLSAPGISRATVETLIPWRLRRYAVIKSPRAPTPSFGGVHATPGGR